MLLAHEDIRVGIVASISEPWLYRSWVFPYDLDFSLKTARVLNLYQVVLKLKRPRPNDYMVSADEKTSIQTPKTFAHSLALIVVDV